MKPHPTLALLPALALLVAGCSADNPTCIQATQGTVYQDMAAFIAAHSNGAFVVCPVAPPPMWQDVGDGKLVACVTEVGDDACVVCLKSACCAEASACAGGGVDCAPVVTCAADDCAAACSADGGAS